MPNDNDWMKNYLEQAVVRRRAREAILADNKPVIIAALSSAGIRHVEIAYDGYGDSGALEEASFHGADNSSLICPDTVVEVARMARDASEIERVSMPLHEAIDDLVYEALASEHSGWEINEGSYGTLRIDLDEARIQLCHSSRDVHYTEIDIGESV